MKKLLLSAVFAFTFFTVAFSQFEVENIYGGATFGWAQPFGKFTEVANGGLNYNAEVGYRIWNGLGVGSEYSGSITASSSLEFYGIASYSAKANYRFLDRKFSPYAGLGLGVARVEEPSITDSTGGQLIGAKRTGLTAIIEAGVDVYGVVLAYRFNYSGATPKEPTYDPTSANIPITMHQFVVGYVYKFREY